MHNYTEKNRWIKHKKTLTLKVLMTQFFALNLTDFSSWFDEICANQREKSVKLMEKSSVINT